MTLKEKFENHRSKTNFKLNKKSYTLMFLDGKNFSTYTKNLEKPFDGGLVEDMNITAKFLCQNIEGCKLAYTQSDEILLFIADYENKNTQAWFDFRLNKILPIAASMATAKFNQLRSKRLENKNDINDMKLAYFDAKAWTVPSKNDVFAAFLYRQNDCVRNSISMLAQSKFSHQQLNKKSCEDMQNMLKEVYNISWDTLNEGLKYGRFIYKCEMLEFSKKFQKNFIRNKWVVNLGIDLNFDNKWLYNLIPTNPFSNEEKWWFKLKQKYIKFKYNLLFKKK